MIENIGTSLYVSDGLFWKAFWALAFGYAFSSLIQVLVPREIIVRHLGRPGFKETGWGMVLGPALGRPFQQFHGRRRFAGGIPRHAEQL